MVIRADLCRCGHERGAHEHLRRGTDCGACGALVCPAFSDVDAAGTVSRVWRRLRAGLAARRGGTVLPYPGADGRGARRPGDSPDESVPREA